MKKLYGAAKAAHEKKMGKSSKPKTGKKKRSTGGTADNRYFVL